MRKRLAWPILAVALVGLLGVTSTMASSVWRTKAYFALERLWIAHWPFPRGKGLTTRLKPVAQPFVPVWVEVEPHVTMLLDPDDYVSRVILEGGVWEPEGWAAVQRHLAGGATFVDVGAHIGYYSLKLSLRRTGASRDELPRLAG